MNRIEKIEDAATTAGAKAMVKATNCVGKLMTKRTGKILVTLPLALSLMAVTVFADGGSNGGAEGTINTIIGLLKTWIPRLGALLVVVGGIQLGIGFKDDDQTGKTRGMQCMIGGAIVAAIGASVSF
ncbi:Uncharacterised protein [uncultured Ruminococcus sp.]|uniref:hypothetical protein n=1 Tax=Huintestinicola butyrica TaxID=2981728 RepID=UPI00082326C9|nr:hypothetical protein [Huintestinicola butyrica]MCU6727734.1 hypothetical protein [Huintestinicola butyrica]SCI91620.1 Uncharacterised protein [uncultured Ruminococcus sp.]